MKNLYKQKREQGFTIIEVMIVLAIAAVILLIVLLAVPALQRSSRNTQRNNEGAKLAAAITTCLANHNNDPATCSVASNLDYTGQQLTTVTPTAYNAASPTAPAAVDTATATYGFKSTCDTGGTAASAAAGNSPTSFAIMFKIEGGSASSAKCISS